MHFNRTKIIATIGPASNSKQKIIELIGAGANVFRLNFSHGTHEDHLKVINTINEVNDELGTNICMLQDLQGPKIRIGEVENGSVDIKAGDELIITNKELLGNANKVSTTYTSLCSDVKKGDIILIDDGNLQMRVKTVAGGEEVVTEVIYGGQLKSRKGINLPDTNISSPSLTEKDREDLEFGLKHDVQWVALSFVRSGDDMKELKQIIRNAGKKTKVIAKVEKPEAVKNIKKIVKYSDAIMVARGDLGVEIPLEDVPMVQKRIVNRCNKYGKPVIIATQMMESMIENPRPTRAETNDVANSVLDGADTIMLSAESAAGKYPVESVRTMSDIISSIEKESVVIYDKYRDDEKSQTRMNDMLVKSACQFSKSIGAKAIVGMTKSGYTAFKLAKNRPEAMIFVFTNNRTLLKTLNLLWGIHGVYYDARNQIDDTLEDISNILKEKGYVESGDSYVMTASMPLHWEDHTNMMKVQKVK